MEQAADGTYYILMVSVTRVALHRTVTSDPSNVSLALAWLTFW